MHIGDWIALGAFVTGALSALWASRLLTRADYYWSEVARANKEFARASALWRIGLKDEAEQILNAASERRKAEAK